MSNHRIALRLWVDCKFSVGFLVRTERVPNGNEVVHVLSRRSGQWVRCSSEQIKENDIPSECLFTAEELPPAAVDAAGQS